MYQSEDVMNRRYKKFLSGWGLIRRPCQRTQQEILGVILQIIIV